MTDSSNSNVSPLDVRRRRPIHLDRLTPRPSVAFIDRMQLRFDRTEIFYNDPSYLRTLHESLPRIVFGDSQLFTRARIHGDSYKFGIKAQWLFKGEVSLNRRGNSRSAYVVIDLKLNFARFVNHLSQQYTSREQIATLADMPPEVLLRKHRQVTASLKSASLDHQDNYINYNSALVLHSHLDELIELYISKTLALILGSLQSGGQMHISTQHVQQLEQRNIHPTWDDIWVVDAQAPDSILTNPDVSADAVLAPNLSHWTLKNTEVYYDVSIDNALSFLHSTKPYWKNVFTNATIYDYGEPNEEAVPEEVLVGDEYNLNSISIVGKKRQNLELSIYAKQHNKLRLEVRYLHETIRDIINISGSDVGTDYSDIMPFIDALIEHATQRVDEMLEGIPQEIRTRFDRNEMISVSHYVGLLNAIHHHASSPEVFDEVIQGMLIRGFISVPSTIDEGDAHTEGLKQTLLALERDEYFIQRGTRIGNKGFRKFTLRPEYYYSFAQVGGTFVNIASEVLVNG